MEYRDGVKARREDRDDYMHVIQLDDGNSQASLACVHLPPHNQPYIVAHSNVCKENDSILVSTSVKGVIQQGKEEYESLMPATVHAY